MFTAASLDVHSGGAESASAVCAGVALAEAGLYTWVRAAQHGRTAAKGPRNDESEALSHAKHGICVGEREFTDVLKWREWGVALSEKQFPHPEGQMVALQLLRFRNGGGEAERSDAV